MDTNLNEKPENDRNKHKISIDLADENDLPTKKHTENQETEKTKNVGIIPKLGRIMKKSHKLNIPKNEVTNIGKILLQNQNQFKQSSSKKIIEAVIDKIDSVKVIKSSPNFDDYETNKEENRQGNNDQLNYQNKYEEFYDNEKDLCRLNRVDTKTNITMKKFLNTTITNSKSINMPKPFLKKSQKKVEFQEIKFGGFGQNNTSQEVPKDKAEYFSKSIDDKEESCKKASQGFSMDDIKKASQGFSVDDDVKKASQGFSVDDVKKASQGFSVDDVKKASQGFSVDDVKKASQGFSVDDVKKASQGFSVDDIENDSPLVKNKDDFDSFLDENEDKIEKKENKKASQGFSVDDIENDSPLVKNKDDFDSFLDENEDKIEKKENNLFDIELIRNIDTSINDQESFFGNANADELTIQIEKTIKEKEKCYSLITKFDNFIQNCKLSLKQKNVRNTQAKYLDNLAPNNTKLQGLQNPLKTNIFDALVKSDRYLKPTFVAVKSHNTSNILDTSAKKPTSKTDVLDRILSNNIHKGIKREYKTKITNHLPEIDHLNMTNNVNQEILQLKLDKDKIKFISTSVDKADNFRLKKYSSEKELFSRAVVHMPHLRTPVKTNAQNYNTIMVKNPENPGLAELQLNHTTATQNQGKYYKIIHAKDNNLLGCETNLRKTRSVKNLGDFDNVNKSKTRSVKNLGEFDSVNKSMNNATNSFMIKRPTTKSQAFLHKKQDSLTTKDLYYYK